LQQLMQLLQLSIAPNKVCRAAEGQILRWD
jgi:hypothetical protein